MTGFFKSNPRRRLRKLVKEKKYDDALKYGHAIEKTLEHDPDIAFILGTIYFIKGNAQKTLYYMDKTLEIENMILMPYLSRQVFTYIKKIKPKQNSAVKKYVKLILKINLYEKSRVN